MTLRNASWISVVLILTIVFLAEGVGAQGTPDLHIVMTGYLLGYYRVPDVQPSDFLDDCQVDSTKRDLTKTDALDPWKYASPSAIELVGKGEIPFRPEPSTIFVGMGDNLAVELYSRTYGEADGGTIPERLHPKLRNPGLQWFATDQPLTIGDNVGCFLSLAGYDAIVPGKEDFYFGPERLRRIAQRLAAVPDDPRSPFHPVAMLAANLVQQTSYWKDPAKIPDSQKELNFLPGLPEDVQSVEVSDHGKVLPFQRVLTIRVRKDATLEPYLCRASSSNDPDKLFPNGTKTIGPSICTLLQNPTRSRNKGAQKNQDELAYGIPIQLVANGNYGLCLNSNPVTPHDSLPHCARFTVARPFFLSPSCIAIGAGTSEQCAQYAKPYVLKQQSQVAIFGVVDPDLTTQVGRDNLSWENKDSKLHTEVAALDPVVALQQATQLFEAMEKEHLDKSRLRKVLLAQMSRAKAEELAAHLTAGEKSDLHFDVIIAAATDRVHSTSPRTIRLDPELGLDAASSGSSFRPVVIAPEWGLDDKRKPINPVRDLTLRDSSDQGGHAKREITLVAERFSVNNGSYPPDEDVRNNLNAVSTAFLHASASGKNDPFMIATLKILRDDTNADLAMMQKRDFYWGTFRRSHDRGGDVARVLWKGDVLRVITASGDTLKKVLNESKQFDQADLQPTQEVEESKRGLVFYGLEPTADDNYLIDGVLLDKDRLYTIATTNHISAGDTGYPELNDPELADKKLPKPPDLGNIPRLRGHAAEGRQISELACVGLNLPECVSQDLAPGANVLFASTDEKTPQRSAGLEARVNGWWWNSLSQPFFTNLVTSKNPELEAQNRPTWRFSVKQFSVSYQLATNNLSEADRAKFFGGITEPGVSGANSHSWKFGSQSEFVRSGKWLDEYFRNQTEYSSQITQQILPAPKISRDKNRSVVDLGIFYHPLINCGIFCLKTKSRKHDPRFGFTLEPLRFDTPLVEETLIIGPKTQTPQLLELDRTQRILMRTGLRMETAKSHAEAGFEGGWERGALKEIDTSVGPCFPDPTQSLQDCLTALAAKGLLGHPNQIHELRNPRGFYVDWDWALPLPFGWKYIAQNQGEWFPFTFRDDNATDTRYRFDVANKLAIPVLSSISFQPGVEYFRYRNKFGVRHLDRWTPTASLDFSFDYYAGGKFWKMVRHKTSGATAGQ